MDGIVLFYPILCQTPSIDARSLMQIGTTLTRFIIEEERQHPEATGEFTGLLTDLTSAAKIISRDVNKAGLAEVMGITGRTNVHGEEVQKLDEFANALIIRTTDHTGRLAGMASEEMDDIYPIPERHPRGNYLLVFDPVDGSSNIDVNVSIGTIFSIYRNKSTDGVTLTDFLRCGREQVCAGYIIYGSSTMLVYTTGSGSHGFTLDPSLGEFLLSHEHIEIPKRKASTTAPTRAIIRGGTSQCATMSSSSRKVRNPTRLATSARSWPTSTATCSRAASSLYPGDSKSPNGKLRLLYEAAPLAFVVEQACGAASNGTQPIMDLQATELHQRTPLFICSRDDVATLENFVRGERA